MTLVSVRCGWPGWLAVSGDRGDRATFNLEKVMYDVEKHNRRCKRDGWLSALFNGGFIKPFNNDYKKLLEHVCNLLSDTQVVSPAL